MVYSTVFITRFFTKSCIFVNNLIGFYFLANRIMQM